MLFTPLWFWASRQELDSFARGATVVGGRISYPAFRLTLARQDATRDLVFWLDSAYARAEWSEPRDTGDLPGVWQVLHDTRCLAIEQPGHDRRLRLVCDREGKHLTLDFFAYGRSGLLLADPAAPEPALVTLGQIPAAGSPPSLPLVVELKPDTPPPPEPCDDPSAWLHSGARGLDTLWIDAARSVAGISDTATDIPSGDALAAWQFICKHGHKLSQIPLQAFTVEQSGVAVGVSLVDFSEQLPNLTFTPADSLSAASGKVVHKLRRARTRTDEHENLLARAKSKRGRVKRRLTKLHDDARQQQDHALWQENADWLTAHLGQIKKGTVELEVSSFDGSTRTIPLDPAIPPSKQADRWYHKARRLRRGLDVTQKQIESTQTELAALDDAITEVRHALMSGEEPSDRSWQILRTLTADTGAATRTDKSEPRLPFRRFRSPGGLAIWVGRNNKENDELTLHHAHKKDLWFHAQQTPGSHVVLRSHALTQTPPKADILAAASVAAFYSKARHSAKVPVVYTEARYVRKPRKAPPGQVLVEREKSVMVAPEKLPEWNETDRS